MGLKLKPDLKTIGLFLGILFFLIIILFVNLDDEHRQVTYAFAIAILMATWWITEALPLAVTSLIPIALYPLFGVMDGKAVSSQYFNDVIALFIGGFIVALAMQKWNLHKRIALLILMFTGVSPARILLGFMFATAFLSMWISNTATTMMMIPILISIINKLEENIGEKNLKKYSVGLLLGVAYSASIGGTATLIGSPPNLMFSRIYSTFYPEAAEISFSYWMGYAAPISIVLFIICFFYLYFNFRPKKQEIPTLERNTFKVEYQNLGKPSFEEKVVFIVFVLLALLWLTRNNIVIGDFVIKGWSNLKAFSHSEYFNDGTVAIFMAIILFIVPSVSKKGQRIMDWDSARNLPWGIVLLFGGGFALAAGIKESGLSTYLETHLTGLERFSPFIILLSIALIMTFLTEITSNTATTGMLLPILAGLAASLSKDPLLFMMPATISASMAFMLPVATPPNAIIFGTNRVKILEMAKTGFVLNILGAFVISVLTYLMLKQ